MNIAPARFSRRILPLTVFLVSYLLIEGLTPHQYGSESGDEIIMLLESGRMDDVREIIHKKQETGDNNDTGYINSLQAQLAFYSGRYSEAVIWMKKAAASYPDNEVFQKMLLYYTAVQKNCAEFVEKESEHFLLRAQGKDIILLDYAADCMEKAYEIYAEIFKQYPDEKIIVEIFPNEDQFSLSSTLSKETLKRSGAIGICKFHRLMIVSPRALLMGYRWMDALAHEFIHLMVNHVSHMNTPLWLHEGTARYYELAWRESPDIQLDYLTAGTRAQLMKAVNTDTLIPFKRMHPSMVYLKNQDEVSLAFSEVASTINFIIDEYGDDAVMRLLRGFAENKQNKNFKKVLGINETGLEKKWVTHMKSLPYEEDKGALKEKYVFDTSLDEIEEYVGADARGHVRLGDKFRKKGRFKVALLQYEDALKSEPENPIILVKLARCLTSLGRDEEAKEKLSLSLTKNPNYSTSYILLADLLYKERQFNTALSYYQEANAINPFDPAIHKQMGKIYLELKQNDLAIKELSIAALLLPADLEILTLLNSLE